MNTLRANWDLLKNPLRTQGKKLDIGKSIVRPVTAFVTVVIITISALYFFGIMKEVPCGDGVVKGLNRAFIHGSYSHIVSNLFAFMVLSRIEEKYGSGFFASLIVQLLVATTLMELIAKQFMHVQCSIGFSAVLFGLVSWELMNERNIDMALFLALAAMVVSPSINNPRASLFGHAVGAIAGVIVALYFKPKEDEPKIPT